MTKSPPTRPPKSFMLRVRLTPAQARALRRLAKQANKTMSAYVLVKCGLEKP